jgi:predicted metal-dependent hydrolase
MAHVIEVRKIPFEFGDNVAPIWNPAMPEWSHMANGASLTMPYLEPFLIKNLREALPLIHDEDLREDVSGFIQQEAQHFTNHRRYNEMLKRCSYPELEQVEQSYEADYERYNQRSLNWRLAYTAGFETMTMGITEWLINDRKQLFSNADPVVSSLVLWHMVEETEHKSVAYDVFQEVCGSYWLRIVGLIAGSFHVGFMSRRAYMVMLKKDGRWRNLKSRLRLWRLVGRFFFKGGGAMLRAFLPAYHPDKVTDPEWIDTWQQAFSGLPEDGIPLLDTQRAGIEPVAVRA